MAYRFLSFCVEVAVSNLSSDPSQQISENAVFPPFGNLLSSFFFAGHQKTQYLSQKLVGEIVKKRMRGISPPRNLKGTATPHQRP